MSPERARVRGNSWKTATPGGSLPTAHRQPSELVPMPGAPVATARFSSPS